MPFLVAAAPYIAMATSALGAIGEGQSAQVQANATAASEDRNAKIADKNAEITNAQYGQREDQLRREGRQQLGAMRAAIGQSGAGLLGSSRDVYGMSARNLEMDALNLRYAGQLEAVGLMNDAAAQRYNAASDRDRTSVV